MKRIVIIVLSLIISTFCVAQECIIKIYQRCESYCHCKQRDFPYVKNWYIESSNSSGVRYGNLYENLEENRKSNMDMDYSFYDYFSFNDIPSKLTITDYIYDYGEDEGKGSKTIKTEFDNIDVGEYSNTSENYETNCQKILWNPSHEGFKIITNVIVDCVVNLSSTNKNLSNLIIENNEKLSLDFGKYYSVLGVDPVLEVNINGLTKNDLKGREYYVDVNNSIWIKLPNKVYPSGGVSLSFEDIVGNYGNDLYKKASGKTMTFRVRKKMINGLDKTGKVVEAKFYHQGPDFSYNKIRQVKCLGGPGLSISVHLADPKNIDMYLNNPSIFHWVLTHYAKAVKYEDNGNGMIDKDGNRCVNSAIFYLTKAVLSSSNDVILVGEKKDDSNFSLEKYLNEGSAENPSDGLWILQLQYNDDSLKELSFISHWFQLEAPVSAIKPTHETGNYVTSDGKSIYSIVSTHTPEIKVNIPTADYENRMDYKIYQFGEGTSSIWNIHSENIDSVSIFNAKMNDNARIATISEYKSDGIYTISNLKVDKTAQTRYFYIQDNDGCIYEVPYNAVQKPFSTTPESGGNFTFTKQTGSTPCDASYSTTIKYDGGAFPYNYGGEKDPNTEIIINDIRYSVTDGHVDGKNTITFTGKDNSKDSVDINLPFIKPSFSAYDQTCSEANGIIKVSEKGTFTPSYYMIGDIRSDNGVFENLKSGKYTVLCYYSDECYVYSDEVNVGSNIFSVTKDPEQIPELEDFDESAKVAITPQNINVLNWANSNTYNIKSPGERILSSGRYDYSVTNTDAENRTCTVTDGFDIKAPHANVTLTVEHFNNSKKLNISQNITDLYRINSVSFYVNENDIPRKELDYSADILDFTAIYCREGYPTENRAYNRTLNNVTPVVLESDSPEDYFVSMPQPKCHKERVTWTLKDGYLASFVGQDKWGNTIDFEKDGNRITIKRQEERTQISESNDFVVYVDNIGYRNITVNINVIPEIDFKWTKKDVSCVGASDGSVELSTVGPKSQDAYDISIIKGDVSSNTASLNFLSQGYCIITVKDRVCSDEKKETIKINQPKNDISIRTSLTQPSCHDDGGVIQVQVSGGWKRYSVKLDDSEFDAGENDLVEFKPLREGYYTVNVTDTNNCTRTTEPLQIKEYTNPYIQSAVSDSATCNDYATGTIRILGTNNNVTLNKKPVINEKIYYDFTPRDENIYHAKTDSLDYSDVINNLAAGTYKLWLRDNNNCVDYDKRISVSVDEPDSVKLTILSDDVIKIKEKGETAPVKLRVDGGNEGYKYVIVHEDTVQVVSGVETYLKSKYLVDGAHTIRAIDDKKCPSNEETVTLLEPEEALQVSVVTTDANCHAETGTATIAVSGGWRGEGGYTVHLVGEGVDMTNYDDKVDFRSLYAGRYGLTVKDEMDVELKDTVEINAPDMLVQLPNVTPAYCDANSGSAMITINGGTPEYKTYISNEMDTIKGDVAYFTNLNAQRIDGYKIVTKDERGCRSVVAFTVPDNRLHVDIGDSYSKKTATMTADVTGGNADGSYSYKWTYGSEGQDMDCLTNTLTTDKGGVYYLVVTNEYVQNGQSTSCSTDMISHSLLMNGDKRMKVIELHRETGEGRKDGMVKLQSDRTDFNSLRLYCNGMSTEIASGYDESGSFVIENLKGGHYSVEGVLADGTRRMADFYIQPYENMNGVAFVTKNVSRPKNADGEILVNVHGGIAPYDIFVTGGEDEFFEPSYRVDNRLQLGSVPTGIYSVMAQDSTGNTLPLGELHVLEPDSLVLAYTSEKAYCYNDSNASVTLTAQGGWGDYHFADEDGIKYGKSNVYSGLHAGQRRFYVMDSYGVTDSIDATIEQPDLLEASVDRVDSVKCFGNNDGEVFFNVKGGTPGYKTKTLFDEGMFDDGREGTALDRLSCRHYTVTFTDEHHCVSKDTLTFYMPQPNLLELANDEVTHTTCDLDNGKIAIEMKGGSLPYTFTWMENGEKYYGAQTVALVRSEATDLRQNGLYHIDIVDKNGCKASYEKRIDYSENPEVLAVATTDVLCYGSSGGIAAVDSSQVKWGYPKTAYHLTWPQGQYDVMSVNTLPTGSYIVRITDDNNCSTTKAFSVGTPEPVKNHLTGIRNAWCYGYSDGRIETMTTGGVGDYKYVWNTGEDTSFADNLRAGTYKVVVTDGHECADTVSYTVTEPEKLIVDLGDDVIICPGSSYTFDAGDFASYQWYRHDSDDVIETHRQLTTTEGGDIHILVKNDIGCMARDTVFLGISNEALVANFLVASNVSLNDTIVAIELSNMQPERIVWEYVNDAFSDVSPSDSTDTYRYLRTEKLGIQYITMWAYKGDCVSSETKQVEVFETVEVHDDIPIGYDPLIQSVKVAPNPNNGEFFLIVTLREANDVMLRMTDVAGSKVMDKVLSGANYYNEKISIGKSGLFILSLTAGDEMRSIKILSVK